MIVHEAFEVLNLSEYGPKPTELELSAAPADRNTMLYLNWSGDVVRRSMAEHPDRMLLKVRVCGKTGFYLCRVTEVAYKPTPEHAATLRYAIGELEDQIRVLQSLLDDGYSAAAAHEIDDYCGSNGYIVRGHDIPEMLGNMANDEDPYTSPEKPVED